MKYIPIALAVVFSFALPAQQDEFAEGMKDAKASMEALGKMEKKTGPKAVEAGEQLGSLYEEMIPFWRGRNAADAVKISEEGKAAAAMLSSGAFNGDEDKVAAALKTIGGTCKACHEAHRDKTPAGGFRVK